MLSATGFSDFPATSQRLQQLQREFIRPTGHTSRHEAEEKRPNGKSSRWAWRHGGRASQKQTGIAGSLPRSPLGKAISRQKRLLFYYLDQGSVFLPLDDPPDGPLDGPTHNDSYSIGRSLFALSNGSNLIGVI